MLNEILLFPYPSMLSTPICYIGVEKKQDLAFSLPLYVIGVYYRDKEKNKISFFPTHICYIGVEKKQDLAFSLPLSVIIYPYMLNIGVEKKTRSRLFSTPN